MGVQCMLLAACSFHRNKKKKKKKFANFFSFAETRSAIFPEGNNSFLRAELSIFQRQVGMLFSRQCIFDLQRNRNFLPLIRFFLSLSLFVFSFGERTKPDSARSRRASRLHRETTDANSARSLVNLPLTRAHSSSDSRNYPFQTTFSRTIEAVTVFAVATRSLNS